MPRKTLSLLLVMQIALLPFLFSQTGEQLRANLYSLNPDSTFSLNDGNLTMYAVNYSNAVDGMDAIKITNFGENFGLERGASTLAIERRQNITTADTIFFKMWNLHQKTYKLALLLTGLAHPGLMGILQDKYLNTSTQLNLNGANNAIFTITNDLASSAPDRFRILFSLHAPIFFVLPVTFTGIEAYQDNKNIDVEWSVENEKDIAQYRVEKSTNGMQFLTVSTIYLDGKGRKHYKWADSSVARGNNYYRINSTDINGKPEYSDITKVTLGIENFSVAVFPNPVVNGIINMRITDQPKGILLVRLINNSGEVAYSTQIQHSGANSARKTFRVNKSTGKGNFILEIISPGIAKISRKILIQ